MSSRCSRRKCQPSGQRWGEVLPLQPDNKDLIQLALLHRWAACSLAVAEPAIGTADLPPKDIHTNHPSSICRPKSLLLAPFYSYKVDAAYYSHLSHWAVQTLNSAYTSPTHSLTQHSHTMALLDFSSSTLYVSLKFSAVPLSFPLDFLFPSPSVPHPVMYHSLPRHHGTLLGPNGSMLASSVRILPLNPYFQPIMPWCPAGYCPVGIWCNG